MFTGNSTIPAFLKCQHDFSFLSANDGEILDATPRLVKQVSLSGRDRNVGSSKGAKVSS